MKINEREKMSKSKADTEVSSLKREIESRIIGFWSFPIITEVRMVATRMMIALRKFISIFDWVVVK